MATAAGPVAASVWHGKTRSCRRWEGEGEVAVAEVGHFSFPSWLSRRAVTAPFLLRLVCLERSVSSLRSWNWSSRKVSPPFLFSRAETRLLAAFHFSDCGEQGTYFLSWASRLSWFSLLGWWWRQMGEIRRKDPCLLAPNVRSVVCSLMVAFTFSFRVKRGSCYECLHESWIKQIRSFCVFFCLKKLF